MLVTRRTGRAALLLVLLALPLRAEDWPQFRGPRGDGISEAKNLLREWPADGPRILWRAPLGGGFTGVIAVDGRLFTGYSRDNSEFVAAFDATRGKELWHLRMARQYRDDFGKGPRSTPLYDGGLVYMVSSRGQFFALAADTGEVKWRLDLLRELDARVPRWGVTSSPIVAGRLLLFNAGGKDGRSIVAFDKKKGDIVWSVESDAPGYSTPLMITTAGRRQAVFFTASSILGLEPQSGRLLWKKGWKTAYDINAAMPVFVAPDRLFVSSAQGTGSQLLRLTEDDGDAAVETVWKSAEMKNFYNSSIYLDGFFYGFDDEVLKCLDARDGKTRWRRKGFGHGTLLYADGHFVVLGAQGRLALVVADPEFYQEVASAQTLEGRHYTAPTLYDGRLYVRNEDELVALEVTPANAR